MTNSLNIVTICGSLRKASYNASLARLLPQLAPTDMTITAAPGYAGFPHFSQDLPVPADVMTLADAVRAADGVIIVSRGGRFLASEQRDSVTTNFTIPSTGAQVAMTQNQTIVVRKVD